MSRASSCGSWIRRADVVSSTRLSIADPLVCWRRLGPHDRPPSRGPIVGSRSVRLVLHRAVSPGPGRAALVRSRRWTNSIAASSSDAPAASSRRRPRARVVTGRDAATRGSARSTARPRPGARAVRRRHATRVPYKERFDACARSASSSRSRPDITQSSAGPAEEVRSAARSGGHSYGGRLDGTGLVVDIRRMNRSSAHEQRTAPSRSAPARA